MKKLFSTFLIFFLLSNSTFALDYSKYNLSDINAIREATKAYQNEFKDKKGTKEAETEFLKFRDFYYEAVEKQNIRIQLKEPVKLYRNSYYWQARKYTKDYADKGLRVDFNGEFYITENNKYLYKNFCSYLNADWCELLKFLSKQDTKRIFWDSVYVISKDELVKIINFYKNFDKKYPNFVLNDSIKSIIKNYEKDLKRYPYLTD